MKIPILPVLAGGMLLFAGAHVLRSQTPHVQQTPPFTPTRSHFEHSVAGAGMVEPRTENVSVGSLVPGVVVEVPVKVGQRVRAGDVLLIVDARQIQAELVVRQSMLASAQAQLDRLQAMPRAEELPPIEAQVEEAQANLLQKVDGFNRSEKLQGTKAISQEEVVQRRQEMEVAKAQLKRLQADEKLLRAGSWKSDLLVSEAAVAQAQAELEQTKIELTRYQVTAPLRSKDEAEMGEWEVLQVDVRPGEYVGTPPGQPLILLGDTGPRRIRVDIDEHDIPRFQRVGAAEAFVRGDSHTTHPLKFVRVEPFVVPKKSLTGDSAERVDTRVLQVLYEFEDGGHEVYVGQQMDVYIAAKAIAAEVAQEQRSPSP